MKNRLLVLTAGMVLCALCAAAGGAATYYIAPGGSDTTGDGSYANPWRTTGKAFAMGGGHTYVLKDGVYQYTGGSIDNPPSGSASGYTKIQAEHDWQAVLAGYGTAVTVSGKSYIQFSGLKIRDGTATSAISIANSHHIKIFRTSIKNGSVYNSRYGNVVSISAQSHHVLMEDSWICGAMRYGVNTTESYNVILRRVVVRFDGNTEREPKSGICFYGRTSSITGAYDCMAQNCVTLDFNPGGGLSGGFTNPHSGIRIRHYGCIALNIPANGFIINEDPEAAGNEVRESAVCKITNAGFVSRNTASGSTTLFDHVSAVNCTGKGFAIWGTSPGVTVKNSIFLNDGSANNAATTADTYNLYYPASLRPSGAANSLTADPGLKYICRIEAGSPAYQSGEGGTNRGATILKRYGVSGTLWGEAGYDQLTGDNLWPWPYEDQIRADFAENDSFTYPATNWEGAAVTPNTEARGFCAGSATLTRYIWGYLGTAIPSDIYGGVPANTPPTAALGANPQSGIVPLAVSFTGSGTDPDGTIAGYAWNFGDGTTATQQNPAHTYTAPGAYTARLTVTDNGGATGTAAATITANAVYSVSGYVRDKSGAAVSGVAMNLSGDATGTATTDASGFYQFLSILRGSSLVITPGKASWSFSPVSVSTISLSGNLTNRNFTGTSLYYIRGYARTAAGAGISGATIALSGTATRSVLTAADGAYAFTDLAPGNYTVTPSRTGYTFAPVSFTTAALGANVDAANFTGSSPVTYYIRGYVRDGAGAGVGGITVALTGSVSTSMVTSADGAYQFLGVPSGGNYTVTPSGADYVFNPAALIKGGLSANMDNQNFTAQRLFHVGGFVRNRQGQPQSGITMTLSGAAAATQTTGNDGAYRFAGLAKGANYTVTPTKNNWGFNPPSLNVTLAGDLDNQDFVGARKYYIKGTVRTNSGTPIGGTTVALSGAESKSVTTAANGTYLFTDLPENSTYTVTTAKSGYVFNPAVHGTDRLSGSVEDWDFTGIYLQGLPQGEIKIIGPAAGRGTVNPDRGESARIFFKGNATGGYELRIFTLTGDLVWQDRKDNVSQGIFEWQPRDVASGVYIADVRGPGLNARQKIAVLR
jgi:PKD repeat protein